MVIEDKFVPLNSKEFSCINCKYFTFNKKDMGKHILTQKHTNMVNKENGIYETTKYICECGKKYKHRQGLYTHKKKCKLEEQCQEIIEHTKPDKETELKDMIMVLVNENKEMRNIMMEQSKQITEIIP